MSGEYKGKIGINKHFCVTFAESLMIYLDDKWFQYTNTMIANLPIVFSCIIKKNHIQSYMHFNHNHISNETVYFQIINKMKFIYL